MNKLLAFCFFVLIGQNLFAAKLTTTASPEVKKDIMELLKRQGKFGLGCHRKPSTRVIESKPSIDAKFNDKGKIIKGSVSEIWRVFHCRTKVLYTFKIGITEDGEIKLLGFEIPAISKS